MSEQLLAAVLGMAVLHRRVAPWGWFSVCRDPSILKNLQPSPSHTHLLVPHSLQHTGGVEAQPVVRAAPLRLAHRHHCAHVEAWQRDAAGHF